MLWTEYPLAPFPDDFRLFDRFPVLADRVQDVAEQTSCRQRDGVASSEPAFVRRQRTAGQQQCFGVLSGVEQRTCAVEVGRQCDRVVWAQLTATVGDHIRSCQCLPVQVRTGRQFEQTCPRLQRQRVPWAQQRGSPGDRPVHQLHGFRHSIEPDQRAGQMEAGGQGVQRLGTADPFEVVEQPAVEIRSRVEAPQTIGRLPDPLP